jgi:hypothetical protein
MDPITGMIEKKAAESVWAYFSRWFTEKRDLKKRVAELEAELTEARSEPLAFERLMSTLLCSPEDDSMYWKKDGSGGPYCPLCLHENKKLIPLTHGSREGSFYCRIHTHFFETNELRSHDREVRQNRQAVRLPSRLSRNSWMGR